MITCLRANRLNVIFMLSHVKNLGKNDNLLIHKVHHALVAVATLNQTPCSQ